MQDIFNPLPSVPNELHRYEDIVAFLRAYVPSDRAWFFAEIPTTGSGKKETQYLTNIHTPEGQIQLATSLRMLANHLDPQS